MRIFVNAGHCPNFDSGAINRNFNFTEADIVRDIGLDVCRFLKEQGQEVKFLQTDNLRNGYDDSLNQPCIITECNKFEADLAVSIHLNAFNGVAEGTECLCFQRGSDGHYLATCIQKRLVDLLNTCDRGVKFEEDKPRGNRLSFIMLTDMPSVIVECGFIDNDDECLHIVNNKEEIAKAIAVGIMEYVNG